MAGVGRRLITGVLRSQNLVALNRATPAVSQVRYFEWPDSLKKLAYNASGFNQYGLYHDDALYESDDVKEALRRLPPHLQDERAFRIQRAVQCSVMKTVLPKDQWPSYDEDRSKGRYLQPYLKEVVAEREEREAWNKQ